MSKRNNRVHLLWKPSSRGKHFTSANSERNHLELSRVAPWESNFSEIVVGLAKSVFNVVSSLLLYSAQRGLLWYNTWPRADAISITKLRLRSLCINPQTRSFRKSLQGEGESGQKAGDWVTGLKTKEGVRYAIINLTSEAINVQSSLSMTTQGESTTVVDFKQPSKKRKTI